MTPILSALGSGISAKKILEYLMRKSPELAPRITKALASGLSAEKIMGFFSKEKNFDKLRQSIQQEYSLENNANPMVQGENIRSKNLAPDMASNLQRNVGPAIGTAASAATAYALSRAIPKSLQGATSQTTLPGNPQQTPQTQSSLPPVNPANIPQQAQQNQAPSAMPSAPISPSSPPVQPEVNNMPTKTPDVRGILDKYGLSQHVDKLSERNKDPKQIAAVLYSRFPKEMKQFQDEAGKHMEDAIGDYLASSQNALKPTELVENPQISPKNAQNPSLNEKKSLKVDEPSYNAPEEKPIAKSDIVASPQGVGEVKEIRGGEAIIDVDGKLHKVKEDDLQPEPEEVKQAKLGFDLKDIPEDLRSAPLNEVYLPHDRRHITVKYNAGLKPIRYIYFRKDNKPIATDYINKIVSGVQLPITSGLNFWGAWNSSKSDSRGTANYHELVANSQEEGEPDDPSKDYWFIKEEALYEHPYLEKKGKEELRQLEKEFNEKRKKPRKKKAT